MKYYRLGNSSEFIDVLHNAEKQEGGWIVPFFYGCDYFVLDNLFDIFKARCSEERGITALWSLVYRKRGEKEIPYVQVFYPMDSEIMTFDLVKEYDD